MKYFKVIWKVNKVRINGVYYNEEHFYIQKVREDKLENFKMKHNVIEIREYK